MKKKPRIRMFMTELKLQTLLEEGHADLQGAKLHMQHASLPYDTKDFHIETAVLVVKEMITGNDVAKLVGKVKTLGELKAMKGEYTDGIFLLEDSAYEVVEGFLAEPSHNHSSQQVSIEKNPASEEIDVLAQIFLEDCDTR